MGQLGRVSQTLCNWDQPLVVYSRHVDVLRAIKTKTIQVLATNKKQEHCLNTINFFNRAIDNTRNETCTDLLRNDAITNRMLSCKR